MKPTLLLLLATACTILAQSVTLSQLTLTNADLQSKYTTAIKSQENLIAEIDMEIALRPTRADYISAAVSNADPAADSDTVEAQAGESYDAATANYTLRYDNAISVVTTLKSRADALGLTVKTPDIITFGFPVKLVIAEIGDPAFSQPLADLVAGAAKNGSDVRINAETGTQEVDLYTVIYEALPQPTKDAIQPFKL